jgi:hypothetical protein
MPKETYKYLITTDFLNGVVDLGTLHESITKSDITVALDGISTTVDGYCNVTFKALLGPDDKAILDGNVSPPTGIIGSHTGVPNPDLSVDADGVPIYALKSQQVDGTPKFTLGTRIGSEAIYATHNFCDQTTWYSESARETNELLSSEDGYVWTSSHTHWIDMTHGRVFDEEGLMEDQVFFESEDPHEYKVIIEVSEDGYSWSTLTQRTPFEHAGGDYCVFYEDGYIVTEQDYSSQQVRASYSRKDGSGWILRPMPGKALTIERAEIQFSSDVEYTDGILMEVYGNVDYFAPQFSQLNGGPLPSGTPIQLETTHYKTVAQLIDESVGTFPAFPALGGGNRGTSQDMYILQFHYGVAKLIYPSLGMYVRISTENGREFPGERCTATFYLISKADSGPEEALQFIASTT